LVLALLELVGYKFNFSNPKNLSIGNDCDLLAYNDKKHKLYKPIFIPIKHLFKKAHIDEVAVKFFPFFTKS
tara:strand:- start:212 stop:424 length:213 start_codon:yes stop_codon:yes gene_type:complete